MVAETELSFTRAQSKGLSKIVLYSKAAFLVGDTQLYKRLCLSIALVNPSIGSSVGPSSGLFVHQSIQSSLHHASQIWGPVFALAKSGLQLRSTAYQRHPWANRISRFFVLTPISFSTLQSLGPFKGPQIVKKDYHPIPRVMLIAFCINSSGDNLI